MADIARQDGGSLPAEVQDALDAMNWHARLEDARERRARVLSAKAETGAPLDLDDPEPAQDATTTEDIPGTRAIYLIAALAVLTFLSTGTFIAADRLGAGASRGPGAEVWSPAGMPTRAPATEVGIAIAPTEASPSPPPPSRRLAAPEGAAAPVAAVIAPARMGLTPTDAAPIPNAVDRVARSPLASLAALAPVDQFADLIGVVATAYPPAASTPAEVLVAGLPFVEDALVLGGPDTDAPRPLAGPDGLAERQRVVRLIGERFSPDPGSTVSRNRASSASVAPVRPAAPQPTRARTASSRVDRAALDALARGLRREFARQARRDRSVTLPGIRLIIRRGD